MAMVLWVALLVLIPFLVLAHLQMEAHVLLLPGLILHMYVLRASTPLMAMVLWTALLVLIPLLVLAHLWMVLIVLLLPGLIPRMYVLRASTPHLAMVLWVALLVPTVLSTHMLIRLDILCARTHLLDTVPLFHLVHLPLTVLLALRLVLMAHTAPTVRVNAWMLRMDVSVPLTDMSMRCQARLQK
jgi:hypothetical protein